MRMNYSSWAAAAAIASVASLFSIDGRARTLSPQQPSPQADGYVWDEACRKCHQDIYKAWAATKHARALDRLSASEREQECVGCHLTGPKTPVRTGSRIVNAGIQCESCHGPGAAHAADPTVTKGLSRKPPEKVCTDCHNERSPHFRGFFYSAMSGFSHRVQK
ncbi:MAG TPA: multiheme c-type cytochrome [Vicinamibacterales bacterium]|nr:multiheme c-type cytochrome [Vicinamibacterales bacterium]